MYPTFVVSLRVCVVFVCVCVCSCFLFFVAGGGSRIRNDCKDSACPESAFKKSGLLVLGGLTDNRVPFLCFCSGRHYPMWSSMFLLFFVFVYLLLCRLKPLPCTKPPTIADLGNLHVAWGATGLGPLQVRSEQGGPCRSLIYLVYKLKLTHM